MEKHSFTIRNTSSLSKPCFPSVNWWRGRLRPYESTISFSVNFCSLNNISEKAYISYVNCNNSFSTGQEYIKHIANSLHEDAALLEKTFAGLPTVDATSKTSAKEFQYCPRCIAGGYHSYLHDLIWLKLCPFHLVPLIRRISNSKFEDLTDLFKKKCSDWPVRDYTDSVLSSAHDNGYANLLIAWVSEANVKLEKLEKDKIFSNCHYENIEKKGPEHSFGRLCCVESLPDLLSGLVKEHFRWTLDTKYFSRNASKQILPIINKYTFPVLFNAYKIINAHTPTTVGFSKKLDVYKKKFDELHRENCGWRREQAGWNYHWQSLDPSIYLSCQDCPNLVVQKEMQIEWGRGEEQMSSRAYYNHHMWFLSLVGHLKESSLFRSKDDEDMHLPRDLFFGFEWQHQALATFFDTVAEMELDVFYAQMSHWLSEINEGMKPIHKPKRLGSVRVIFSDGRLKILKWQMII